MAVTKMIFKGNAVASKEGRIVKASPLSLQALTAAALCLPGLMQAPAHAAEEEASFTYGHYQEGRRELFGAESDFNPIEVDSLQGSAKFKLTDRIKFAFNYIQDTWSGATPITTLPLAFGGNGGFTGSNQDQVMGGATPFLQRDNVLFDAQLNPLEPVGIDQNNNRLTYRNNQLVHTLSLASPETRKQGDFKLGYEWDEAALDIGGGISIEDDYESRFGNINGRWDFNQKLTSLNLGLSYTNSDTHAILNHDATTYIWETGPGFNTFNDTAHNFQLIKEGGSRILNGNRQDWGTSLGLTQILNKNALLEAGFGYIRSTGYMANPYKAVSVAFIDPAKQLDPVQCPEASIGLVCADIRSLLENRPDERNQWNGNLRYVQHIDAVDAAVHLGYRIFKDDWGITSHTFDADWAQPLGNGWTVTPRVRYYSQDAANFYNPYLVSNQGVTSDIIDPVLGQAYTDGGGQLYFDDLTGTVPPPLDGNGDPFFNPLTGNVVVDGNGNVVTDPNIVSALSNATKPFDRSKLPAHYSSDQRLSGYGALSGGVTVSKQFAKGLGLDVGFEYYTHQGSLKLGGGGEGAYSNFDYWTANATLKMNLDALSLGGGAGDDHAHHHQGVHAPAGVMFDHMLPKAGDMMVGYRYMYSSQGGPMLHGTDPVSDQNIVENGCVGGPGCFLTPDNMAMHMHMLDLMYAPTDWLTLMLMPQFVDMSMGMRKLDGAPTDLTTALNGHLAHHLDNGHETGGIGDLGMYALFKLFDNGTHHVHITGGLSAPTGDVNIQLSRNHQMDGGFIHYGMQLGSGTWDFKPSLTYTGHIDQFSWGAQANGTVRMENQNSSGYALGDLFQATAWGGYNLTHWLTATVRGVYTSQGRIKDQFNGSDGQFFNADGQQSSILKFGPMDYPSNYGGKYWDVGFGLSAVVPSGDLAGNRISVEWLQPVEDDVNGYQLERDGALSATWSVAF